MEKLINNFKISFTKGDTYALAVKFKNISEDLRCAYFTVKENPDDEPLIQKSLGAGIDKIDDREYKNEKTYKVQLQSSDTANLEANVQYLYDLQVTLDNVVKTVLSGVFVVHHTVTGVTSTTTATLEVAVDDELETELLTTPATNGIEYETDPVAMAIIGDMSTLNTTAKKTIVQAINEVKKGNTSLLDAINSVLSGETTVPKANQAETANTATKANQAETANTATKAESLDASQASLAFQNTKYSAKSDGLYIVVIKVNSSNLSGYYNLYTDLIWVNTDNKAIEQYGSMQNEENKPVLMYFNYEISIANQIGGYSTYIYRVIKLF